MSTKTYLLYGKIAEKKRFTDANPPQKGKKPLKLLLVHTNVFFTTRTVVVFMSHPKCSLAYFNMTPYRTQHA